MQEMKDISKDIITQGIRKDLLHLMAESSTALDFFEWAGQEMNSNKKSIALKFQTGTWDTDDFAKIEKLCGGEYLAEAMIKKFSRNRS